MAVFKLPKLTVVFAFDAFAARHSLCMATVGGNDGTRARERKPEREGRVKKKFYGGPPGVDIKGRREKNEFKGLSDQAIVELSIRGEDDQ